MGLCCRQMAITYTPVSARLQAISSSCQMRFSYRDCVRHDILPVLTFYMQHTIFPRYIHIPDLVLPSDNNGTMT